MDQCNLNENSYKLFCEHQQTDSKVYMDRQKTQINQYNTEKQQSQKRDTTHLEDLP